MTGNLWTRYPAGAARQFSSPELTFCSDSYFVCFPPSPSRVNSVACKTPLLFCQKYRWQVKTKHAYTLDPKGLTMVSRHSVGTYQGSKFTHILSNNTGPHCPSLLSHCGLILAESVELVHTSSSPPQQKAQAGNDLSNFPPKSLHNYLNFKDYFWVP